METEMAHLMYLMPDPPPVTRPLLPVSVSEAILRERLNPVTVATIWSAMETTEPVCILYRRDAQISARVIWPERVWVTEDDHVAVRGYDSRRGAVRTFRADRIADAHVIEP